MKKIIFFLLIAGMAATATAQDVIVKKDGSELQAKVTKVSKTEVEYKKFDNLEGPVYTLDLAQIFMIKYENGSKDVFNVEATKTVEAPQTEAANTRGNILWEQNNTYYLNDRPVSWKEFKTTVATDPQAWASYKKGFALQTAGGILTGVGASGVITGLIFYAIQSMGLNIST
jgi:hypothetical protein